jgi:hypothetical protein
LGDGCVAFHILPQKRADLVTQVQNPATTTASPVRAAIANASRATGMDFSFLMSTAVRESSLNPMAEASTSSAAGLFQFLDQTWLTTVKRHGARHGMGAEARMIEIGADGQARVDDPQARRAILNMRFDPEMSARMAAEFANDNADQLRVRTGREPQAGDLYAAHFLGVAGASQLINAASERPWESAASMFPAAARANRSVFYTSDGRPKTVVEMLEGLRATANRQAPPVSQVEFAGQSTTYMLASRWQNGQPDQANSALAAALSARSEAERQLLSLIGSQSREGAGPFASLLSVGLAQTALDGRAGGRRSRLFMPRCWPSRMQPWSRRVPTSSMSGRKAGSIATALSPGADRSAQKQAHGHRTKLAVMVIAQSSAWRPQVKTDAPVALQSQPQFAALQARPGR